MKMRKMFWITLLAGLLLLGFILGGCSSGPETKTQAQVEKKPAPSKVSAGGKIEWVDHLQLPVATYEGDDHINPSLSVEVFKIDGKTVVVMRSYSGDDQRPVLLELSNQNAAK